VNTAKARLTEGPVGDHLRRLTLPMAWGIFAIIAINLVDTFFIGQLGPAPLAAMGFLFPVTMVLSNIAMGLGIGAVSVVSRAIGAGRSGEARRLATDSLVLALLFVGAAAAAGLATIGPLFRALGATPEVLPLIADYMEIWYIGMVFLVVPMVGNSLIRATGDARVPGVVMTIAAVVNLVLDPLLIFGLLGFPRMEIQGAALATLIAYAFAFAAAFAVLHFRERMIDYRWPGCQALRNSWGRILAIGLPAAAGNMVAPLALMLLTRLIAGFGPEAVAGFGVAGRIEAFALLVFMALSASMGPFVGQNWGAGRPERVRTALGLAVRFAILWGMATAALLALFAEPLARVFSDEPAVVATITRYLYVVPVSFGLSGVVMVSASFFTALGRPLTGLALNAGKMLGLYLPLAWLASGPFGLTGIFTAASLSALAVGLLALAWHRRVCNRACGD
jgi:putative MATE family efflux protein